MAKEENNDLVLAVSKANISHTVLILGRDNTNAFKAYSTGLSQNNYVKAVTLIGVSQRLRLGGNDVERIVIIPQLTRLELREIDSLPFLLSLSGRNETIEELVIIEPDRLQVC